MQTMFVWGSAGITMEIMISTESALLCYGNDEHPQHSTTQILRIISHCARSLSLHHHRSTSLITASCASTT